jgi:hypothetical protein
VPRRDTHGVFWILDGVRWRAIELAAELTGAAAGGVEVPVVLGPRRCLVARVMDEFEIVDGRHSAAWATSRWSGGVALDWRGFLFIFYIK